MFKHQRTKTSLTRTAVAIALLCGIPGLAAAQVVWREALAHPADIFGFGNQANANSAFITGFSSCSRIASDDGRYVAFASDASNLVRNDSNNSSDVFLRDLQTGQTRRISVSTSGEQLESDSTQPCMSADGRYITYQTSADVTDETNHRGTDVYLFDRIENTQLLISRPQDGCASCAGDNRDAAISGDGNWVVFRSNSEHLGVGSPGIYDQIVRFERASGLFDLISQNASGDQADNFTYNPSISDDGRFVAFRTRAGNLGTSAATFTDNVFVRDTILATTTLVSKASDGTPGDDDSYSPVLSGNGQYIVYSSTATNLVANDSNGEADVFVYRLGFESVERVSIASDGSEGSGEARIGYAQISGDGGKVAFVSDSPELAGTTEAIDYAVFVHDRNTGDTELIGATTSSGTSAGLRRRAFLNPDGSRLWLISDQSDWVVDDSNGAMDAFSIDLDTGDAVRVSLPDRNLIGPSGANAGNDETRARRWISEDGRYVVFGTPASNLVAGPILYPDVEAVYLLDRLTRETTRIADGEEPTISADGRFIAFASEQSDLVAGDANEVADIFIYDRSTAGFVRASVSSSGEEANGASSLPYLAAGGRHAVFESAASNLVPGSDSSVFLHDLDAGTTESIEAGSASDPSVSADGRYIAFSSRSSDLVPDDLNGDEDIFLRDRVLGITRRVSVSTADVEGDGYSEFPTISDDGNHVVFSSGATNLVTPADIANRGQIYLHEVGTGVTELVSVNDAGEIGDWSATYSSVSADGRYVAFNTGASNLSAAGQPTGGRADYYLHLRDRVTGTTRRIDTDRFDALAEQGIISRAGSISADGRFVLAISGYTDLHLDAGRYNQTDTSGNYQPFLLELAGFAEPTTVSTVDLSTLNAEVGVPVTVPITVTGDASAPLDGVASIDAETGEVCLQTDRVSVGGEPNARRFDCEITFRSRGEHQLSLGFSVSQTHESSALLVPISVTRPGGDPNQPPTAESQTLTVTPDTPRPITLLASDPDGDVLTFVLGSAPTDGSLSGTPPNVTYTPDPGFVGEDSFSFGVTDGIANSGPATITLIVSDVPVPVADGQIQMALEDTELALTLTGISSDGGPLSFAVVTPPSFGALSGNAPDMTYTPSADFFGVDSFTFTVSDGAATSEPATVNLIVEAVNDPPSFTPGPDLSYPAGSSGVQVENGWATAIAPGPLETETVSFELNATDPAGVITAIAMDAAGTLSVTLSGTDGEAIVEVIARDEEGAESAPAVFTVTVGNGTSNGETIFGDGFES